MFQKGLQMIAACHAQHLIAGSAGEFSPNHDREGPDWTLSDQELDKGVPGNHDIFNLKMLPKTHFT